MKRFPLALACFFLTAPAFANDIPMSDEGAVSAEEQLADTPSPRMGKGFVCAAKDGTGRYFFGRARHALEAKTLAAQRCRSSGLRPSVVRGCHLVFCQPQFVWSSSDID